MDCQKRLQCILMSCFYVGKKYGCHSWGKRWSTSFVGDHMPPNKLVRKGQQQRFYPQCTSCSNLQGECMNKGDWLTPNVCNVLLCFFCVHHNTVSWFVFLQTWPSLYTLLTVSCFAFNDKSNYNTYIVL